jgi:hypothetical protein
MMTVIEKTAYLSGFLVYMTIMTLMAVICGRFLKGARLYFAMALPSRQGDPVHPEAVVTGNFGSRDNRRRRPSGRKVECGSLRPQEPGRSSEDTALKVTEVIKVIGNQLPGRFYPH